MLIHNILPAHHWLLQPVWAYLLGSTVMRGEGGGKQLSFSEKMPEKHGAITSMTFWLVKNAQLLRSVLHNCALVQQNAVF